MSENCLVFESIFAAFWTPKIDEKSMKNRSSGSSWAKMAPRRCHLEPTWLHEPIFEWFSNQILNQFRLLSDWSWADICSLQEQLFIIFRSILNHFKLMSGRFQSTPIRRRFSLHDYSSLLMSWSFARYNSLGQSMGGGIDFSPMFSHRDRFPHGLNI